MHTHLAAYILSGATGHELGSTDQALDALTDVLLYGSGTSGFMLPDEYELIAAYANGEDLRAARVVAPSLLRVGYPSVVPVERNPAGAFTPYDPNLMDLLRNPVRLRRGERVVAQATPRISGSNLPAVVLLWLRSQMMPVPEGESFWLPYHLEGTPTLTGWIWNLVTPSFDQTLPSGTYMVAGIDHYSVDGIAVRVASPGSACRPGALVMGDVRGQGGGRNHEIFYGDHLGSYGVFDTDAPPTLELLLSRTRTASDDSDNGLMRVVRLGDVGLAKRFCQ